MGVTERKLNVLLENIREKKIIEKAEIMELLEIKERSVKYYIQKLRNRGVNILSGKEGYHIEGEISLGSITDKEERRFLSALQEVSLSKRKMKRADLIDQLYNRITAENSMSRKTIERTVIKAIDKGYFYVDNEGYICVTSRATALHGIREEHVLRFLEKCDYLRGRIPFGEEVENIVRKIEMTTSLSKDDSSIIVIGRDYKIGRNLLDLLGKLESLDYRNHCIELKYRTKNSEIEILIEVVTLYFSALDDQAYLIGYPKGLSLENPYFYLVDSILGLVGTDVENTRFQEPSSIFKLKRMIGASLDGPYEIEVRFDLKYNIREKLERYQSSRESAKVHLDSSEIVLKDTIYGLADFARYLRGFGSSCRVTGPDELRDKMRDSYIRLLKRYEENDKQ